MCIRDRDQRLKSSTPTTVLTLQDAGNIFRLYFFYKSQRNTLNRCNGYGQGTIIGKRIYITEISTLATWSMRGVTRKARELCQCLKDSVCHRCMCSREW